MESTRFTGGDIEGHHLQERLPRVPQRNRQQRRKSSCCSNCNSQIVCSYLIALISSSLVVGGVYLAIIQWNRIWLIISISGIVLTLFGSCLYYCGTQALINSNYSDDDEDSYDYEEEENGDDETRHFPSGRLNQRRGRGNKNKRRKRRGGPRASAPDFVTRSLSQLSLNMIPQYFSPADTSFIRVPPGSNINLTGFNSTTSRAADTSDDAAANVPVSQIFSVNGQSYLILPLNGDHQPPDRTLLQRNQTIPTYYLPSSASNTIECRGIPLENLVNIKAMPNNGSSSQTTNLSEKGDITSYLAQLDPNSYQLISTANCDQSNSGSLPVSQNNQFGTKINRKSLNRGRVAPGHGTVSSNIQGIPLPPTPSIAANGSVPVNIIDHNPLARINSVTVNGSGGQPGSIPIRSSSLRSNMSNRPLIADQGKQTIDDGQPGQASTSNYFISFNPSSSDGKVSSGSSMVVVPSASNQYHVPLSISASTSGSNCVTGNHNHHHLQPSQHPSINSVTATISKSSKSTTTTSNISASGCTSSSSASIQRGDTFSKKKKPTQHQQEQLLLAASRSSPTSSPGEDEESPSSNSDPTSSSSSSSSANLTTTNTTTSHIIPSTSSCSSSFPHGQQQTATISVGNNGYLPLKEVDDLGEGVKITTNHGNQRRNHLSSSFNGNGTQQKKQDTDEDRERLIDLSSIESSLNLIPSTSSGITASNRHLMVNDQIRQQIADSRHCNQRDYSFDGPSSSSQVTEMEAEHCHAMFAAAARPDDVHSYTDGYNNIYEDTEDLIEEMVDDSQFSPPPSYLEVIQDTQGINYASAATTNYDSRIPSFINPSPPATKSGHKKTSMVIVTVDSKVSSNPATDCSSSGAIHSTGTL